MRPRPHTSEISNPLSIPSLSLSVSYVSICFHKLSSGLYCFALSVSFCIAPWSLFVFLSLFGTLLWACCRFPSTDTHPPLAVHCPRLCCCSHTFPLLYGFCQSISFALPVFSCLSLYFLVFAPCYFLSVPHCFLLLLAQSTLLRVSPCCFALQSTPSQS